VSSCIGNMGRHDKSTALRLDAPRLQPLCALPGPVAPSQREPTCAAGAIVTSLPPVAAVTGSSGCADQHARRS
jgi:hypothetical protein